MPKACSVGSDERGSCTGIAVDVPGADAVGAGFDLSEAGVNGEVVVGVEAEPLAAGEVAADDVLVGGVADASAGGIYCAMGELSGTE